MDAMVHFSDNHMPWINTMVDRVFQERGIQGLNTLITYVRCLVLNTTPSGLARAALFMLVANLALRCHQNEPNRLWMELYQRYSSAYDITHPQSIWSILNTICYSWFIKTGPVVSIEHLTNRPEINNRLNHFIVNLRSLLAVDFIDVLRYSATTEYIKKEVCNILLLQEGLDVMVILRMEAHM
jgi:hypothetical protein